MNNLDLKISDTTNAREKFECAINFLFEMIEKSKPREPWDLDYSKPLKSNGSMHTIPPNVNEENIGWISLKLMFLYRILELLVANFKKYNLDHKNSPHISIPSALQSKNMLDTLKKLIRPSTAQPNNKKVIEDHVSFKNIIDIVCSSSSTEHYKELQSIDLYSQENQKIICDYALVFDSNYVLDKNQKDPYITRFYIERRIIKLFLHLRKLNKVEAQNIITKLNSITSKYGVRYSYEESSFNPYYFDLLRNLIEKDTLQTFVLIKFLNENIKI